MSRRSSNNSGNNMPDIDEMFREMEKKKNRATPSRRTTSPATSPTPSIDMNIFNKFFPPSRSPTPSASRRTSPAPTTSHLGIFNFNQLFSPPASRKTSPAVAPAVAPEPKPISSPDRKFAHLHDGTNSGNRDSFNRIIYHGPRGGRFVISSIGKRVPHVNAALKAKVNSDKMVFSGKYDRKGRKIFFGRSGGKFVITEAGRRANPLV